MSVDYKFSRITDGGNESVAKIVFYTGEVSEQEEMNDEGEKELVTRYRRTGVIDEKLVTFSSPLNEVKIALNKELKQKGTPIEQQTNEIPS